MLDKFEIGYKENKEGNTGVTVVLAREGAVAGCFVMGASPATRETDLLKSENTVDLINAVVLSGGSAFGLDACSGVVKYLKENKIGYKVLNSVVPIVVGASIFDLSYNDNNMPDAKMGYEAAKIAEVSNFKRGNVGAGAGATVGKALGPENASKSGQGFSTVSFANHVEVAAITVVNAFGDIVAKDGKVIKGINVNDMTTNDVLFNVMKNNFNENMFVENSGANTTLSVVLTNAKIDKIQANRLAMVAHDAYARAINPVHTQYDGDIIFVLSSDEVRCDLLALQSAICNVVENSIRRAI